MAAKSLWPFAPKLPSTALATTRASSLRNALGHDFGLSIASFLSFRAKDYTCDLRLPDEDEKLPRGGSCCSCGCRSIAIVQDFSVVESL